MASPEGQIENLTRRIETLTRIITANSLCYICPQCFCGFREPRLLYRHFREPEQGPEIREIHAGLDIVRTSNHLSFLLSYRDSVRTSMTARDIPRAPECFATDFVVEHYGEM
ncbi:hypothetical protein V6Z93_002357 [Aspergillus fumigatus]